VTKDFHSDNILAASPEVLDAIVRAAAGPASSYGEDEYTTRVRQRCSAIFETEVEVFPVLTGTAANALSLAAVTPPDAAVLCHDHAHIERDELHAAELLSGGARLLTVQGDDGKLTVDGLTRALAGATRKPASLSVTNATEGGTVYTPDELRALGDFARANGLRMHLDGARFANAVASTGAAPADLTWRAGVDLLSFGATKNGAFGAEVIVVFSRELANGVREVWQRSGHRLSKMRLLSAQLEAYLTDDLWLRNARHANAMAARLRDAIASDVEIVRPVQANVVFVRLERPRAEALLAEGYRFYDWGLFGDGVYRLVTGFSTQPEDVDMLAAALRGRTGGGACPPTGDEGTGP
jgi:threonine aldolase